MSYQKSSIILYHKQTDLSICFARFFEKCFSNVFESTSSEKKGKRKPLSLRVNHALIAALRK